jgi:hypothetical protein
MESYYKSSFTNLPTYQTKWNLIHLHIDTVSIFLVNDIFSDKLSRKNSVDYLKQASLTGLVALIMGLFIRPVYCRKSSAKQRIILITIILAQLC